MTDTERVLTDRLKSRKKLYERLLELSESMNTALDEGADPNAILPIMEERETVVAGLKENDERLLEALSLPGAEKLMDSGEPARAREEMEKLLARVIEADEKGQSKLEEAMGAVGKELSELARTRRSVGGYGNLGGRSVFAKYKDIKL